MTIESLKGPQDVGSLQATLNQLIEQINTTSAVIISYETGAYFPIYTPSGNDFNIIVDDVANSVQFTTSTGFISLGATVVEVTNGTFRIQLSSTPASAAAAGVAGTIAWDANFIYVCTATNTWKRVAIATW